MCTAILCCAGQAICCASKSCCKCLCCCCKKCGTNERSFARIGYVFFSMIWVVIAILIMFFAPEVMDPFDGYIDCPDNAPNSDVCYGISTMYRISFLLGCFHVVMLFFGLCPAHDGIRTFHDGCWLFKFGLILIALVATFFIHNDFFKGYGYLSQVVSIFYLIYQVIALVSFAYLANDRLVAKYSEGSNCVGVLLILFTVIIYSGSLTLLGMMFYWFDDCDTNLGIIISTLVAGVLAFILVLIKTRQDASIFTTSMVFLYTVYIAWSAMGSRPDAKCNRFAVSDYNTGSQIAFGLFFALLALLVTSAVSKSDSSSKGGFTERIAEGLREENEEDDDNARKEDIDTAKNKEDEIVAHKISRATVLFHLVMVTASIYYAMVLTNWGNPSINSKVTDSFGVSWLSFWVKMISQWITFVLFFLTLLLPLCSKRDYS